MIRKLLVALSAVCAAAAFAAVDVNKADQATLETIKGIGPDVSARIIDERKKGAYKDWTNLVDRVGGIGEGNAARFSAEGLTVDGLAFKGAAAQAEPARARKDTARKDASSAKAELHSAPEKK